jgi:flagellar hook-associated protein 3 FlgL
MRVSTNTIFEQGIRAILQQQEALLRTQQQVSTGRRIVTPADDPVAAARALDITQAESLNIQYTENRDHARSGLSLLEGILQGVTSVVQDVRTITVNAGNPTLSNNERAMLAEELRSRLEELVGLANSTDGSGQYLFSGYQGMTKPFAGTATGVQYSGDQGQRVLRVGASREIPVSASGDRVFEHIRAGNGVFTTAAAPTNAGSGVISPGAVTTPLALTGHDYQINFTVSAGVTTYDVLDATTATTLSTANPYISGSKIVFDGIEFDIQGTPAHGDQFVVSPSPSRSLFKSIEELIAVVTAPVTSAAGAARLANGLNSALLNLDRSLDHILGVRATVGAHLQEIDALQSTGDDLALQYQQNLSQLQDLDYARALSDLNRQQLYLEAAQKSFLQISGLSLFNHL